MSQIRIDVNGVQTEYRSFKSAYRKIKDEAHQLSSSRTRIDGRIAARRSIDSRLSRAGSRLMRVENQLEALYDFIEHGLQSYIQADDKAKEHPFEKKKKKSIWDKIGDGLQAAAHGVTGFMEGTAEAVIGTVEGLWTMVTHPIETVQGLVYVVKHPLQTAQGIWKALSDSWTNEVVNGDADSRGRWFGRMIGEVALSVVGTKGVDKVAKLAKGTKIVQEAGGVKIVRVDAQERVLGQSEPPNMSPKQKGDTLPRISTEVYLPPKLKIDGDGPVKDRLPDNLLGKNDADPFREIYGPGRLSHPEEWNSIIKRAQEAGVEVRILDRDIMAYAPRGSNPGQLNIYEDASISALRHEYQHFLDDKARGYPKLDVTYEFKNRIIMELRAYMVEIKEADRIGNKALVEQLWNNYRAERQYLINTFGPVNE
ncbi:hypothetical protein [Cohnella sp. GCM10027633]|uniref:hypothetical protein n=1 Tax=unclassified Cohnella TaxID=2636738 RepID=UPI003642DF2D